MPEAAERLSIPRQRLAAILRGDAKITRHLHEAKRWTQVFETHYADKWAQYRSIYQENLAALRPRRGGLPAKPPEIYGLAAILSKILGGENMDRSLAAKHLKIHGSRLNAILRGKLTPSQSAVAQKGWRQTLKTRYPDGWKAYGADFDLIVRSLPPSPGRRKKAFPSQIGNILWEILGARHMAIPTAARRLGCDPLFLNSVIFRGTPLTMAFAEKEDWPAKLQRYYSKTYARLEEEFRAALA